MSPRRSISLSTAVALTLGALCLLFAASPASAATKKCSTKGATVAGNKLARVFSIGDRLLVCRHRDGFARGLTSPSVDQYTSRTKWDDVRLVGSFVSWHNTYTTPDHPGQEQVWIYDVRSKRVRTVTDTRKPYVPAEFVMSGKGVAAWTTAGLQGGCTIDPAGAGCDKSRVHVWAPTGSSWTLDAGDIQAGSIAVSGATVSWINGGVSRSATANLFDVPKPG